MCGGAGFGNVFPCSIPTLILFNSKHLAAITVSVERQNTVSQRIKAKASIYMATISQTTFSDVFVWMLFILIRISL